jgi:methylmalonyl-CoA mutase
LKTNSDLKSTFEITREMSEKIYVIPPHRTRYLSEIAESNRHYDETALTQEQVAQKLYGVFKTIETEKFPLSNPGKVRKAVEDKIFFLNQFDKVKDGFIILGNHINVE